MVAVRCVVLARTKIIAKLSLISFPQTQATLETPLTLKQTKQKNTPLSSINRWAQSDGITPTPKFCSRQVNQQLLVLLERSMPNKLESSYETASSRFNHHPVNWGLNRVLSPLINLYLQGLGYLNRQQLKRWLWNQIPHRIKMAILWVSVGATR